MKWMVLITTVFMTSVLEAQSLCDKSKINSSLKAICDGDTKQAVKKLKQVRWEGDQQKNAEFYFKKRYATAFTTVLSQLSQSAIKNLEAIDTVSVYILEIESLIESFPIDSKENEKFRRDYCNEKQRLCDWYDLLVDQLEALLKKTYPKHKGTLVEQIEDSVKFYADQISAIGADIVHKPSYLRIQKKSNGLEYIKYEFAINDSTISFSFDIGHGKEEHRLGKYYDEDIDELLEITFIEIMNLLIDKRKFTSVVGSADATPFKKKLVYPTNKNWGDIPNILVVHTTFDTDTISKETTMKLSLNSVVKNHELAFLRGYSASMMLKRHAEVPRSFYIKDYKNAKGSEYRTTGFIVVAYHGLLEELPTDIRDKVGIEVIIGHTIKDGKVTITNH